MPRPAPLRGDELRVAQHEPLERLVGPVPLGKTVRLGHDGVDLVPHHGRDQIGPQREVPVERRRTDAGALGDRADVDVDSVLGELRLRRSHESDDVSLGIRSG
ncbi:hypothetical protein GCM10025867_16820 [Frondihabitans sucicola]|uniref:Uncharacterized protein n=1 Tax=Frondihabitans sucicola TaxID=1268041 RepID=A0ABN6Y0D9_9MICO|nr:hypothetical protein GCM10025867_16820 [Frondihabitans sucicola]